MHVLCNTAHVPWNNFDVVCYGADEHTPFIARAVHLLLYNAMNIRTK